ncbi:MAG: Fic family protein [Patescibacteria group bacterium]
MSDKLKFTPRLANILTQFEKGGKLSSGQILESLREEVSIATLKRDLTKLVESDYVLRTGGNKDSEYELTDYGLLHRPYGLGSYYLVPEAQRRAITDFNFEIFDILKTHDLFSTSEINLLDEATANFKKNAINASGVIHKKELERFVIEFAWKSSKIEGNTYTLLETERLIREGLKKNDRSEFETSMILNHKRAYEFLMDQTSESSLELSRRSLETIHSLVVRDLGVGTGLRKAAVGISGSLYRPLSLVYQIEEQLNNLVDCINAKESPYEKALIAVLGESYLQPFEDGNKRTARVLANGILLQAEFAPLSYRSVSDQDYKEATLIFYEQNSIEPFKKIFIEQYIFAANNYNIAKIK